MMDPVQFLIQLLFLTHSVLFGTVALVPDYDHWDEEKIVAFWEGRIGEVGPHEAHEELIAEESHLTSNQGHTRDHFFGQALFSRRNFDDILVCTETAHRLRNGCLHEYIGQTLSAYGPDSLGDLLNVCEDLPARSFFSCRHGIGHGLLAFEGYDVNDLESALRSCYELTGEYDNDGMRGCAGGAFMEYSMRTMLDDAGEVRESADIMSPCSALPKEYQFGCLYWQPLWWRNGPLVGMGTGTEPYALMGEYCRGYVRNEKEAQACFAGIGNFGSGGSNYHYELAGRYCDAAAATLNEELYCRIRAHRNISNDTTPNSVDPQKVCIGLTGEGARLCEDYVETGELPTVYSNGKAVTLEEFLFRPLATFADQYVNDVQ